MMVGPVTRYIRTYLLPDSQPFKKKRIEVMDVAEEHIIWSSNEELDILYQRAKKGLPAE